MSLEIPAPNFRGPGSSSRLWRSFSRGPGPFFFLGASHAKRDAGHFLLLLFFMGEMGDMGEMRSAEADHFLFFLSIIHDLWEKGLCRVVRALFGPNHRTRPLFALCFCMPLLGFLFGDMAGKGRTGVCGLEPGPVARWFGGLNPWPWRRHGHRPIQFGSMDPKAPEIAREQLAQVSSNWQNQLEADWMRPMYPVGVDPQPPYGLVLLRESRKLTGFGRLLTQST